MAANSNGADTHYPFPVDAGNSITQNGFRITTRKLPILKSGPIDEMTSKLRITPPEMIFGDNLVSVEHPASGWGITFNAFDALDRVDKTGESMLKVAYSREWQKSREKTHEGIKEIVKPFDWSYTTDYKGTLRKDSPHFEPSARPIPLELLKKPDPILFFDEVMLYEDELADNGIAMLSCKIRVMPARMLLLCRFFMRLDDVIFRIRDTRIYVDFGTGEVIREYVAKEDEFENVRKKLATTREDVPALMRDANKLAELLPVVDKSLDRVLVNNPTRKPSSMASKRLCTACQRYCQSNIARLSISQPLSTYRTLSTTSHSSAAHGTASKTYTPNPLPPPKAPAPSKNAKIKSKPQPPPEASPTSMIAQRLRKRASSVTETYIAYGASEQLTKECARPAEYSIPQSKEKGAETPKTKDGEDLGVGEGWWYTELGLAPTFNTWAQITFLHMYLLTTRIRCFPAAHAPTWHQHLLDHFFYEAEKRMTVLHALHARGVRNRYLKDLFVQWRGAMAGYDEGLMKGDAVLAAAVWRNVFKADEEVDLRGVGMVVSYMRRVLRTLESVEDEVIVSGRIRFGDPSSEVGVVGVRSKMMDVPVAEEEIRPVEGKA